MPLQQDFDRGFIKRAEELVKSSEHPLSEEQLFKLLGTAQFAQDPEQRKRMLVGPHIREFDKADHAYRRGENMGGAGILGALLGAGTGGTLAALNDGPIPSSTGLGAGLGMLSGAGLAHMLTKARMPKDTHYMDDDYDPEPKKRTKK